MTRPADSAPRLAPLLGTVGAVALLVITLASPGATRMHSSPWSCIYAFVLLAPAAVLLLRIFDRNRPLILPARSWCWTALAGAVAILASALTSPYRGPSLLWSAPLLAGFAFFFVAFDEVHATPTAAGVGCAPALKRIGLFFAVIALTSLGLWLAGLPGLSAAEIFNARNPYPLGHSNYTAGLALLMLPCFTVLAARTTGATRIGWAGAGTLAVVLLITSGSRGGLLGLGALMAGGLLALRLGWKKTLGLAGIAVIAGLAIALAHPRTRAMFQRPNPAAEPNLSNVQRAAMAEGGKLMGEARPLLGWGPGTTPLAYPRFRAFLDGGVENVLQLHSLPVQLWAELGAAGLAGLLVFVLLAARHATRCLPAAVTLGGYAVFALTDYQLDVPVFAFAVAGCAALLAPAAPPVCHLMGDKLNRAALGLLTVGALAALALAGRPDPTPAMNLRALALAGDATQQGAAVALFNQSLALNPDQEIAHFNLGWLLVVRDPAAAESHFLAAAHLVPDKGGVYFGLGLARLNQEHRAAAVRAFALECLNDPVFLVSPWWRQPALGKLRPDVVTLTLALIQEARSRRLLGTPFADREAAYLAALILWLDGTATPGEILGYVHTSERVGYFSRRPPLPEFATAPLQHYRRERSGYPVLMRDLDLPVPTDLFDVEENSLATGEYRFLFPAKGWLPGPLLLQLLEN
jgi:tetratricopeptide (TPR) repeat protein